MNNRTYIIVTPVKNEEKNLPKLIESVTNQTIIPSLWVIVDDGSTDKSSSAINDTMRKYGWIRSIRLKERGRDISIHYAYVCKIGFDFAIEYCKNHKIEYEYIGLVDADNIFEEIYFENLIKKFKENPKLGIASGCASRYLDGKVIPFKTRGNHPFGAARLWRRKCFKETGGYQITCLPDTISLIKAKLRGWEIKRFNEMKFITRESGRVEGLWKRYKAMGYGSYFVHQYPFFVVLKGLRNMFRWPFYIGFAFLYGYFNSIIHKKQRLEDKEIKEYYCHQHIQENKEYYMNRSKKTFKKILILFRGDER